MDCLCLICRTVNENEKFSAVRCGHCYHTACIEKWLQESQTCPECKSVAKKESLIKLFAKFSDENDLRDEADKLSDEIKSKNTKIQQLEDKLVRKLQEEVTKENQKINLKLDLLRKIAKEEEAELKRTIDRLLIENSILNVLTMRRSRICVFLFIFLHYIDQNVLKLF